jgi:hypothetical protein
MLKSFLTPLRTSFSITTPRTAATDHTLTEDDHETPEDFARDAMVDLMRINVEELRLQTDSTAQCTVSLRRLARQSSAIDTLLLM